MPSTDLPDFLGTLRQMQAQAGRIASRFAAAADLTSEGRDESGTVQVTVGMNGRVSDIKLATGWREAVPEHGLAGAVLRAVATAQRQGVTDLAHRFTDERPADQPAPDRPPAAPGGSTAARRTGPPRDLGEGLLSEAAEAARADLIGLLRHASREVGEAAEARRAQATTPITGKNAAGTVTVRITGAGQVQTIEFDERRMRAGRDGYASEALGEAFSAAYREIDGEAAAAAADHPALARLQVLVADPDELMSRLFGGR
jgi:DNA-binding protein YbaB